MQVLAAATLLCLAPGVAWATCSEIGSSAEVVEPMGATGCVTIGAGAEVAAGRPLQVAAWAEVCCHGMGQTTDLPPCTYEGYEARQLGLRTAAGDAVVGMFEPVATRCSGVGAMQFAGELAPGGYQLVTPAGAYNLTVVDAPHRGPEPAPVTVPVPEPAPEPTAVPTPEDPSGGRSGCAAPVGHALPLGLLAMLGVVVPLGRRAR